MMHLLCVVFYMLVRQPTNITICQVPHGLRIEKRKREFWFLPILGVTADTKQAQTVCVPAAGTLIGAVITSFHPRSNLAHLISVIHKGTYGSKRLSDLTKVAAGERQKTRIGK